MAARVAAGLAPWTRMVGFIANRLKVLEAELQASQTQHGTDTAASQQRQQDFQAQIEELQLMAAMKQPSRVLAEAYNVGCKMTWGPSEPQLEGQTVTEEQVDSKVRFLVRVFGGYYTMPVARQ
ncbi:hypothetical protein HaLaN_07993, partial [Haematococcus lacustris]